MNTELTLEFVKSVVRHGISVYGGALVSRGLVDASQLEQLSGAAVLVLSVGWSLYRKWARAKEGSK